MEGVGEKLGVESWEGVWDGVDVGVGVAVDVGVGTDEGVEDAEAPGERVWVTVGAWETDCEGVPVELAVRVLVGDVLSEGDCVEVGEAYATHVRAT